MGVEHARRVRASRGAALDRLRLGQVRLADVLRNPPSVFHGIDLYYVLMACPRISRDRCRTICERAKVWPHLPLGDMTKAERYEVIRHIPIQRITR